MNCCESAWVSQKEEFELRCEYDRPDSHSIQDVWQDWRALEWAASSRGKSGAVLAFCLTDESVGTRFLSCHQEFPLTVRPFHVSDNDESWEFLGFDVADGWLSSVFCMFYDAYGEYIENLDSGLIRSYERALELCTIADERSLEHRPFFVFAVFRKLIKGDEEFDSPNI